MSQRPLPAEIYWRRRLVLLAAVIALVWVALQVLGGGGDDDTSTTAATPTPTVPATPSPVAKVDGVVDVSLVSATAPCDVEKIRVTPSVRPQQVTKGAVDIGLVVSSTSKSACTLEPDDADLLTVISANGTPVWDSTVCKASLLTEPVAVSPRWASFVTVEWSGRGSGSTCSSKEGYATPGQYAVQVGALGGEPGKTTFRLEARPAPKPTKATPTPSKSTPTPKPPKGTTKPADE